MLKPRMLVMIDDLPDPQKPPAFRPLLPGASRPQDVYIRICARPRELTQTIDTFTLKRGGRPCVILVEPKADTSHETALFGCRVQNGDKLTNDMQPEALSTLVDGE